MGNLSRWGAAGGFVAAAALVWVGVAVAVVMPGTGLGAPTPYPHYNPDAFLPFIARRPALFGLVNLGGGALAALGALVFFVAVAEHLRATSTAASRVGGALAVAGAVALAGEALLWQMGVGSLAALFGTDPVAARHAFYALAGLMRAVDVLGTVAVGLGVLVFSGAMRRVPALRGAGALGVVGGVLLVGARLLPTRALFSLSALAAIIWLVWTGALLLRTPDR
jgi:hypothetical protein